MDILFCWLVLLLLLLKLRSWVRTVAGHHHERLEMDAVDRIFNWLMLVAVIWFVVIIVPEFMDNLTEMLMRWATSATQSEAGDVAPSYQSTFDRVFLLPPHTVQGCQTNDGS